MQINRPDLYKKWKAEHGTKIESGKRKKRAVKKRRR